MRISLQWPILVAGAMAMAFAHGRRRFLLCAARWPARQGLALGPARRLGRWTTLALRWRRRRAHADHPSRARRPTLASIRESQRLWPNAFRPEAGSLTSRGSTSYGGRHSLTGAGGWTSAGVARTRGYRRRSLRWSDSTSPNTPLVFSSGRLTLLQNLNAMRGEYVPPEFAPQRGDLRLRLAAKAIPQSDSTHDAASGADLRLPALKAVRIRLHQTSFVTQRGEWFSNCGPARSRGRRSVTESAIVGVVSNRLPRFGGSHQMHTRRTPDTTFFPRSVSGRRQSSVKPPTRAGELVWRQRLRDASSTGDTEATRATAPAALARTKESSAVSGSGASISATALAKEAVRAIRLDSTLVDQLADDVIRRVDRRARIEHERRGL